MHIVAQQQMQSKTALITDPDIPTKAPEFLATGVIGKYYRPISD